MPGAYQGSPRALRESHRQHAPGPSFVVPSPMTAVQAATGRAAAGSERVPLKLPPVETSVRRDHDRHLRQRSLPRGCDRRRLGCLALRHSRSAGRQAELFSDRLLYPCLARPGCAAEDVLLETEDVEHRIGLLVVLAEPDGERFLGVILPGDQLAAACVALSGVLPARFGWVFVWFW